MHFLPFYFGDLLFLLSVLFVVQLDGTVDLDERRLIRSAIRELRRREIEDMEAALATKRFRPTRLKLQEDKENQHRYTSSDVNLYD